MKKFVIFIIIGFLLLVNCKAPEYLPKKTKVGEVEYFDFEEFEKKKDEKYSTLILYGYSFGGALLLTFLNRLKKDGINVNLLITIDAAKSVIGFTVNRTIPNNVKHNLNIYQKFPSRIGSRGLPNEGTNVKNVNITDEKLPNGEDVLHKNIDEYTLLYCAQVFVYALKGIYSFQNYNEKEIKKQIKEYASQGF